MGTQFDYLKWFWSEEFWLPPNVSWDYMADTSKGIYRTKFGDLCIPILLAFFNLALKNLLCQRVFKPLGIKLGIRNTTRRKPPANSDLEQMYWSKNTSSGLDFSKLSSQLDMSEKQIKRWFKLRALLDKPTKLDKFGESCWRGGYTFCAGLFGWYSLWDKVWFWEITDCWHRYPDQSIPSDIWAYYMIKFTFYWTIIISQMYNERKKDYLETTIHHLATIALLAFSWACNLFKVGSLVLWVHDISDPCLDLGKVLLYLKKSKLADMAFYLFAASWVITRLGYFPTWIIYSVTVEAPQMLEYFPAYHLFSLLLSTLLVLHLFWFYFVAKMGYLAYQVGKVDNDVRSDDEEEDDSEEGREE